jgi:hypothetical protein
VKFLPLRLASDCLFLKFNLRGYSSVKEGGLRMADRGALVPDPLQSDRQYIRFYHLDIPSLEDTELTDELYALQPLLWELDSEHWLRERVENLEAELAKRRYTGHEFRGQPKPKLAEGVKL